MNMRIALVIALLCPTMFGGLMVGQVSAQTTWYVDSGWTGNAPFPVLTGHANSGRAEMCGPDTANGTGGSDESNPGTASLPFASLRGVQNAGPRPGDTIKLAGRIRQRDASRYALLLSDTGGGMTIEQWAGRSPACIRAENMPGGTLSQNKAVGGAGLYWTANGPGYDIVCDGTAGKADLRGSSGITGLATVTYDWDLAANIDSAGRRLSHLSPAASAAEARAAGGGAQGKWYLDLTTGTLSVGLPGSATPGNSAANGIEYVPMGQSGISFQADSGLGNGAVFVRGNSGAITFQRYCDAGATAPAGSALNALGTTNAVFTDLVFEDAGDHAYAFGGRVNNATTDRCDIYGAANGCYAVVFNASGFGGTSTASASNARWVLNTLRGHDGMPVDGGLVLGGYVHGPHTRVEWNNITIVQDTPPSGPPDGVVWFHSDNAVMPADLDNPELYPVLVRNPIITNATAISSQTVTSYIAFVNPTIHGDQQDMFSNGFLVDLPTMTGCWLFVGGEITTTLRNIDAAPRCGFFRVGAQAQVRRMNCSLYDRATTHTDARIYCIDYLSAPGARVADRGSILGFRDVASAAAAAFQVVTGDTGVALSKIEYADNIYTNVTRYADDPSCDTPAEWIATVDDGAIVALPAFLFADAGGTSLEPTEQAKELRKFIWPHVGRGVNGPPYSGQYGAYQYRCPSDFNGDGNVDLQDFLQFMSAYEAAGHDADFNGDGFRDPLDYNGFINAFEAGDPSADFNADGFLDPLDYNGFINAFESSDLRADFNGDGLVNELDYDQFIEAFEAGC